MIAFTKLLAFSKISLKRSSSQGISTVNLELAAQQSNAYMTNGHVGLYCWPLSVCSIQLDNLQHAKRPLLLEMQALPRGAHGDRVLHIQRVVTTPNMTIKSVCVCVCVCVCASACLCAVCTLVRAGMQVRERGEREKLDALHPDYQYGYIRAEREREQQPGRGRTAVEKNPH